VTKYWDHCIVLDRINTQMSANLQIVMLQSFYSYVYVCVIICGCIHCRMKSVTLLLSTIFICDLVSGNLLLLSVESC